MISSNHLTIVETRDWRLVWDISQHPAVNDRITDDQWAKHSKAFLAGFVEGLVTHPNNHVLLVLKSGVPAGCWILDARMTALGAGVFEVHTLLLPECRGADALAAGRRAITYAFTLPDVRKLISYCPAHLPEAYLYARLCGFQKAGLAEKKWIKNGQEYPMRLVELFNHESTRINTNYLTANQR
jgi:hypothetical protein